MSNNAPRGKRNGSKIGRPTKYKPEFVERVLKLDSAATNTCIAAALGVGITTVHEWQKRFLDFRDAIKRARERADGLVESALHTNAVEKHNVAAQIFWLKNRRPDKWRDKIEHEVKQEPIQFIMYIGGKREVIEVPPAQVEGDVGVVDVEPEDASE